jgi:NAD(P)-dependent dehydrogenase (short-subunit alcohol dehydrogenase family)
MTTLQDPRTQYPRPPYPAQQQDIPASIKNMQPRPDHGEDSYKGNGKLNGRRALITGGDSGIGRAVAIAFAREGADVAISYLNEDSDAKDTSNYVKATGKKCLLMAGDISEQNYCEQLIQQVVNELGGIDIIVSNAAFSQERKSLHDVSPEEWDKTFKTNVYPLFWLCRAAEPHLQAGSCVITTASINAYKPAPQVIAYNCTKAAIQNFTAGLAQLWGKKGIRVNSIAPGPVWTPLIPASMAPEGIEKFGSETPLGRVAQPAELAPAYVLLASGEASYINGATLQITGGMPAV